jgi:hypothetical protein
MTTATRRRNRLAGSYHFYTSVNIFDRIEINLCNTSYALSLQYLFSKFPKISLSSNLRGDVTLEEGRLEFRLHAGGKHQAGEQLVKPANIFSVKICRKNWHKHIGAVLPEMPKMPPVEKSH